MNDKLSTLFLYVQVHSSIVLHFSVPPNIKTDHFLESYIDECFTWPDNLKIRKVLFPDLSQDKYKTYLSQDTFEAVNN